MSTNGRNDKGQFVAGGPGGPGRPRRAVESEYLAAVGDMVPLDVWREIVGVLVQKARNGDVKAIAWLATYVLGTKPASLIELAVNEQAGTSVDDLIASEAGGGDDRPVNYPTVLDMPDVIRVMREVALGDRVDAAIVEADRRDADGTPVGQQASDGR